MTTIQVSRTDDLRHSLAIGREPEILEWTGRTENAVQTEIFLDGIANARLQLPPNGIAVVQGICCAFNLTDSAGTTHGDVLNTFGAFAFMTRRATTAVPVVSVITASPTAWAFTGDDATDSLRVLVTGLANKSIVWKAKAIIIALSNPFSEIADDTVFGY